MSKLIKLALVAPGKNQEFAIQEPLNLGYLAAFLEKNNIQVKIIDQLAGQNVYRELKNFSPQIVGITGTTPVITEAYKIADFCRKNKLLTIMGGSHVSVLPNEALQHADIVVRGEGEAAILEIIRKGIKSGIVSIPYIKNLDDIPPPARHLMQMDFYLKTKDRVQESYLYFAPLHSKVAAMIVSRGCPYHCIFCHNTWRGIPFRFHSPERVISEMKALARDYGVGYIFFIDDNLFVNKSWLREVCQLMIKNKINIIWGCNTRVDNIDLEILQMVKSAGCRQLTFGFESGSQRILNILKKGTTVEQNRQAIELCKKIGLFSTGTFMLGNPTETIEDIRLTQQFIRENDIDNYGVCLATPFPGTDLWRWCESRGLIPAHLKWSDFNFRDVPVQVCEAVPTKQLLCLCYETAYLIKSRKSPILLRRAIGDLFRHPIKTIFKLIRHPSRFFNYFKRLKT